MSEKKTIVVLGAGIGGLSAGYFLAKTGRFDVTVLEKAPDIGGVCSSFEHDGFVLDYGAHKLYSVIPGILDEIRNLMGDRLLTVPKKNRIFLRGHLLDYPLKLGNLAKVLGMMTFLQLGFGYALTMIRGFFDNEEGATYEEYILKRFGRGTYELVFEPLADKVWGDPSTLHADMACTRLPVSGGLDVILKLLGLKKETKDTSAEHFYFPRKGFRDFPDILREKIEEHGGRVIVNSAINKLEISDSTITDVLIESDKQEQTIPCDYLVSSIPLSSLGELVSHASDNTLTDSISKLEFRHVIIVYVFIKKDLILEDQWIFFPERQYIFSRIFEQKQMNPELGPKGKTALCCDFTCTDDSWQWKENDDALAKKCVDGLVEGNFIKKEDVYEHLVVRFPNFYPRYDLEYREKIEVVMDKLKQIDNLLLSGRIGMYNYNNADHCLDMGKFIAERLETGEGISHIWKALSNRVANYKIVD